MNLRHVVWKSRSVEKLSVWFYSEEHSKPSYFRNSYICVKTIEEGKKMITTHLKKIIGEKGTQSGRGMHIGRNLQKMSNNVLAMFYHRSCMVRKTWNTYTTLNPSIKLDIIHAKECIVILMHTNTLLKKEQTKTCMSLPHQERAKLRSLGGMHSVASWMQNGKKPFSSIVRGYWEVSQQYLDCNIPFWGT